MHGSGSFVLSFFLVCGILSSLYGQSPAVGETSNRIQLQFNTSGKNWRPFTTKWLEGNLKPA